MNAHLYDTAPNGSEIQKLIGREADLFRATEAIAPKAAQLQGTSKVGRFINKPLIKEVGKAIIPAAIVGGAVASFK